MKHTALSRRRFLATSGAAAGLTLAAPLRSRAASVNEEIGLAVIGTGGRGTLLTRLFSQQPGARIVALCDADEAHVQKAAKNHPGAATETDMQRILDRSDVDAVVIATPNHWHCLAAIRACQAGKDVYVEKPLGHNLWEQEQLIKAAQANDRIVQIGTQQRSSPIQAAARKVLHEDQAIGKLSHVIVSRIGKRAPIGLREKPLTPPASLNYDLWLGPAKDEQLYRDNLHYDWHWDWNTGNGEMGNWGVHVLDDVLNVAMQDQVGMPSAVHSAGVRAAWNDAGTTPNLQVAYYDNQRLPAYMILSNVVPAQTLQRSINFQGFDTGYTVYGEGGRFCGSRGHWRLFDTDGKLIEQKMGDEGTVAHQRNFLDAVRSRDAGSLAAPVEIGALSTAWCHLAGMAALEGEAKPAEDASDTRWQQLLEGYHEQATEFGASNIPKAGQVTVNTSTGQVGGLTTSEAQQLAHREYRSAKWADEFQV